MTDPGSPSRNPLTISLFGLGYVGCVTAACLARDGQRVIGVDVNPAKVELIERGRAPIVEPGLPELIADVVASGRLSATVDASGAVAGSDVSMICVGSPSKVNGSNSVEFVERAAVDIGRALRGRSTYHVVALRSTVLPGTLEERIIPLLEEHSGLLAGVDFGVCSNPEFLRESSAIRDYYEASFVLLGALDNRSADAVARAYDGVAADVVRTDIRTAELLKYVNNGFHALKAAFANEIGVLCKAQGVDGQELMKLLCRDARLNISTAYLRPAFAFGGSCLPKDVRALVYRAKELDLDLPLLRAVLRSNEQHVRRAIAMVEAAGRKRVGVLGLSFKAGTDDVRESPTTALVEALVGRGYDVAIFDEAVRPELLVGGNKAFLERALPHVAALMRPSADAVLAESDVVVVANGSPAFRDVRARLRDDQLLIDLVGVAKVGGDGRGAYDGICW